jgi:hypothetical protein
VTGEQRAALESLLGGSSADLPWRADGEGDDWAHLVAHRRGRAGVIGCSNSIGDAIFLAEDARLIAAAVNALPELLADSAERDRLRIELHTVSDELNAKAAERDRLTDALHAVRAHPDWLYCGPVARSEVEGLEADGWERNEPAERPGLLAYRTGAMREMRRRRDAP